MAFETDLRLEESEDTQHGRFLTFALGEEEFGIEISYVTEIIGMQPISTLPEIPEHVKGIVNLRGKIIPVIDMRLRFKKPEIDYTDRTCIVIIDTGVFSAGLIVDSVAEVMSIGDEQIVPPPNYRTGIHNQYLKGIANVDGHVKLLLDCEKLFMEEEQQLMAELEG